MCNFHLREVVWGTARRHTWMVERNLAMSQSRVCARSGPAAAAAAAAPAAASSSTSSTARAVKAKRAFLRVAKARIAPHDQLDVRLVAKVLVAVGAARSDSP